jgi:DNA-binding response OmpR family regulator
MGVKMKITEKREILKGRKILIVDDEEDVLNVLEEILEGCDLDRATSFEEAKKLLESNFYDAAVLDIMGVRGYDLLKIADDKNIPAIMLTAHALSKEDLLRSIKEGASYYAPKDKITKIGEFIADVLEARERNKNIWANWFESLGDFYDKKFGGTDWREDEQEFWEEKLREWDS